MSHNSDVAFIREHLTYCNLYSCVGVRCPRCGLHYAVYSAELYHTCQTTCPDCEAVLRSSKYILAYQILTKKGFNVTRSPEEARYKMMGHYLTGINAWGHEITLNHPVYRPIMYYHWQGADALWRLNSEHITFFMPPPYHLPKQARSCQAS